MKFLKPHVQVLAALLCAMAGAATAQTSVTVNGTVFGSTCTIATDPATLTIPPVDAAKLNVAGAGVGSQTFTIKLTGATSVCNPNAMTLTMAGGNAQGRIFNLLSGGGAAGNVDVILLYNNSSISLAGAGTTLPAITVTPSAGTSTATSQPFELKYVWTGVGQATPGSFQGTFTYTVVYS